MLYRQSIINIWRLDGSDAPEFRGEWWDRVRVIDPTKNKKWNKYEILHYWHVDSYGEVLWCDKFLVNIRAQIQRWGIDKHFARWSDDIVMCTNKKRYTVEYSISQYVQHVYKTRRYPENFEMVIITFYTKKKPHNISLVIKRSGWLLF